MRLNPRDVLLNEFRSYYNSDELELFIHDALEEQADQSARRMVRILGDRAIEVAALMQEMATDPGHLFYQTVCSETLYDWDAEPYTWDKFQILAQRMSDGITNAINKPDNETSTISPNSTQERPSTTQHDKTET